MRLPPKQAQPHFLMDDSAGSRFFLFASQIMQQNDTAYQNDNTCSLSQQEIAFRKARHHIAAEAGDCRQERILHLG